MSQQIPAHQVPITPAQFVSFVGSALRRHTPAASKAALALLYTHFLVETGGKPWNYNFGDIRGVGPSGLYVELLSAWECAPADKVPPGSTRDPSRDNTCSPGSVAYRPPNQQFAAYASADEGASDWIAKLSARYPRAFAAMLTGDPKTYAYALHNEGYYTASPDVYANILVSRYPGALVALAPIDPGPQSGGSLGGIGGTLLAIFVCGGFALWLSQRH